MTKFYESELEKAVVELLVQAGFGYSNGDDIKRSEKDVLLQDDLQAYLKTHYTDLTPSEIQKIISQLELVPSEPLYTGSKLAFSIINEGIILPRDQANLPAVHIRLIDFDCVENNRFRVVNQFKVIGEHERIPDVILFINGIPVTIMELKSPINEDVNIYDAWKQIHIRYRRDIPKLLKYTFLSVISDGANNRLGSVFTPYDYYYTWNRVDDEKPAAQNGIGTLLSLIEGALTPKRLLELLRDFIYYPDKSDNQTVVVARYPQFFAANKIFDNIKAHLRPMGDGKGGTYFGATGCGKTYTMLYLTRLLIQRDQDCFNNPTVIIITDREDLDSQAAKIFTNAKTFLGEEEVLSIESRQDLANKLKAKPSGGVYLTTIQKFAEYTGLLSSRNNIICISDEAHRTQTGVEQKLQIDEYGVKVKYGFAKYLRDAFPNATYVGFTGTPIDETLAVFGEVVDKYTMKQSSDDGITVRIAYEPRLARVLLSDEKAKEIQHYYESCAKAGSTEHEIEKSKKEMSQMRQILAHPERLHLLAADMVTHYEALCAENPAIVKKAMIVCADRQIAYQLLQNIVALRPDWDIAKKCDDPSAFDKELDKLVKIEKIKLVATRNDNDPPELYQACGTKEYRKELDRQFKDTQSNFKIAVVVDMWITGFDVPSLAVMYIDKPLQKHTLIQTISRVNRNFEGKEQGIVVDYIGIKNAMMEAIKLYGNDDETPVDDIKTSLAVLRNHIKLLDNIMHSFDASDFYQGPSLARLHCLNLAAEYVQVKKETTDRYMGLSKRLKSAYEICVPTGELNDEETAKCQFFLAVRSIIYKQHTGGEGAPDTEIMNQHVAQMVQAAITSTGIENIIDAESRQELFDASFEEELSKIDLPISKFHALLNLLKKAIGEYGKTNKVKSIEFNERMKAVVERYNNRDNLAFVNEVVSDFINSLSDEILKLLKELDADKDSFAELGISLEEKAFYDILISIRDAHQFDYADDKCLILSQKIKVLVDDNTQFSDWALRDDIKNKLNMELTLLLYQNGYPPQWNSEVFDKVLKQAENFKRYN